MTEALLEAGAILPGTAQGDGVDTVTARSYRHPVLDGRTVVRLVGAALGPAEDLTMEFLGFAADTEPVPVGHARRQALGFPAWALVHDPANGRHALALVKEMERLARVAKSKPGNAKEGYDTLAVRLGAAAPQFLPTFWEQAGRAFIAGDNARMAGSCFTEARRAEQVHGLVVDEDRVRDVHLEFAFAGALTATMLTEYARGVTQRRPALEAYELVRALAVRRVAGGLAPHASMAADLARLAKAAGLDPQAQADGVVAVLLTFPAMARSHPTVWKAYRESLIRLGKSDPAIRRRLLEVIPEPPGYGTDMTAQWLELLAASGAEAELNSAAPAADVSAGRWLERMLARRRWGRTSQREERLLLLVERMTPRLVAEGRPLALWPTSPWQAELDLLDICLAGGVPVAVEASQRDVFDVASWVGDSSPGRRDLTALAADPRLRPMLARGVRSAIARLREGTSLTSPALPARTISSAFAAAGVRDVLHEVLVEQVTGALDGTVISLDEALGELAAVWSPAGVALAPETFRRLLDIDLPTTLARTLRTGVLAEFTWPAYEQAASQKRNLAVGLSWPEVVVNDNQTASVVFPDGTVTEHVFQLPPANHPLASHAYSHTWCWHVDGDLLVNWARIGGQSAYWRSRPADLLDAAFGIGHSGWGMKAIPIALPGGGVTLGGLPVHAGDSSASADVFPVAYDGRSFWRCQRAQDEQGSWAWRWREFDPVTGRDGRWSTPAFFAGSTEDSGDVIAFQSHLRPAPEQFAASPLGWRDGLVGWRVARLPDGTQTGKGIDGRQVSWRPRPTLLWSHVDDSEVLVAAVTMPGSATPLPVTGAPHHRGEMRLRIWTPDGEHVVAQHLGLASNLPPVDWWHALRPRDEAGSSVLRGLSEQTAADLMAVADSADTAPRLREAVATTIAAHLPGVTDDRLRSAVGDVVVRAVRLRQRIAELPRLLAAKVERARAVPAITDDALRRAWEGLAEQRTHYYYGGTPGARHDLLEQVAAVGTLLAGGSADNLPAATPAWVDLLAGPGALAMRAAAAVTTDGDRAALAAFLLTIAGTPLAGDGPPIRVLRADQASLPGTQTEVRREGEQVTVLLAGELHNPQAGWRRSVLQSEPSGAFTAPEGVTVRRQLPGPGGWTGTERLRAFCALLADRGPAPWRPEAAEALAAATGMTRAEAVLLLAGLPGINAWEANFLTAEQRRVLGLNAAHAKIARESLRGLTGAQRVALLDAAMPADPAGLWEHGPAVDAIATRWVKLRGRRAVVPEELVAEVARVTGNSIAAQLLQVVAQPARGDWLSTDGRTEVSSQYQMHTSAAAGTAFDTEHLRAVALALPWLAYRLPWGDPLRAALPRALQLVRERLRNPDLLVGSSLYDPAQQISAGPALVRSQTSHYYATYHIAPAKLSGDDDPALGFADEQTQVALRIVLSRWIDAVVAVPQGGAGLPHDPRFSVPELVTEVAARFGLDEDAAAYYLQLLALPDPTDRAVQAWNGWKPARLKAAQSTLVAAGLAVAAKRERAGRPVFLPGGWQPAKAPSLPLETWKQELYLEGAPVILVPRPIPELFAAAWARVVAGDVPRYRDLKEKP
jgi:hypothetical protein